MVVAKFGCHIENIFVAKHLLAINDTTSESFEQFKYFCSNLIK